MKKVGDLFAELGFRPDGSDSVKRAFVENLVRAAGGDPRTMTKHVQSKPVVPTPTGPEQLSFKFDDDPSVPFPLATKRSVG